MLARARRASPEPIELGAMTERADAVHRMRPGTAWLALALPVRRHGWVGEQLRARACYLGESGGSACLVQGAAKSGRAAPALYWHPGSVPPRRRPASSGAVGGKPPRLRFRPPADWRMPLSHQGQ